MQSDELGLARAVDLVDPVQKTLTEGRSQSYLDQKLWPNAVKDANNNNVEGHREQRRSSVSSHLKEAFILALGRSQSKTSVKATNRVLFFSIIDLILSELSRHLDESREIMLTVAAWSP